jgi:hypothetical protein
VTRPLALGIALAVAAAVSLGGLSRAAPPPPRIQPQPADDTPSPTSPPLTATVTAGATLGATATLTATVTPTATATSTLVPTPTATPTARPAPPGCRVAGTPFEADALDGNLFWARVQNTGPVSVTLTALQLGWGGAASLGSVVLRRGAGPEIPLFAAVGIAGSPALVSLTEAGAAGGAPQLRPGETASLGLRFKAIGAAPAGPVTPGAALLFTAEGCLVPLAAPPTGGQCALRTTGVRTVPSDPAAILVGAQNAGGEPLSIASIEVRWPVAENGALTALSVEGGPSVVLGEPAAASPVVLDLARLFGAPLTVAPGQTANLRLVFARAAAPPPALYSVVLATRDGCLATATTALGVADCGVSAQGFETRSGAAVLRLANRRSITRSLTSLTVFWPVATNGPLTEVAVDGHVVWTGELRAAPGEVVLPDGVSLPGEATAQLSLAFRPALGSDGKPGAIAHGDYAVVAWLQGGCAVPFATASGQPLKCSVSAGEWVVNGKEASVDLTNAGAEATLRQAALSWPRRNGSLEEAWLGNSLIYRGPAVPRDKPLVLPFGPGTSAVLPRSDTRTLRLKFNQPALAGPYSASLAFNDPAGAPCADVLVTARPTPVECQLSLPAATYLATIDMDVTIDNQSSDSLEIASVTVDWPNPKRELNLVQLFLVDAFGTETLIWRGRETDPPATIRPNQEVWPLIGTGRFTTLRFRYGHRLDDPRFEQEFRTTLSTVEGCQASYAPTGGGPSSQQASFKGVVRELPIGAGLYGAWRIQTDLGERLVRVDRTTRFEPASVSPRVGDTVAVRALVAEGRYYAEKIDFVDTASYQTLEGVVEELGPGQKPAWLKVAGTLVAVGDETMIQGPLELGAGVTVLAKKYPDGNLVAETITIHSAPQGERIAFDGVLQEGRPDGTSQVWEVDRYTVRIPASVVINGLPSGSPPPLGRRVQGIGRLDGAEVVAESISVLPDPVITSLAGIVTWMPPIGLLGEWRVDPGDGHEIRFRVESLSALDTRVAPAERGMLARLRLQDSGDGQLPLALRVRMDWPD